MNPACLGAKAAFHYRLTIDAGGTQVVRLRLTCTAPGPLADPFETFDAVFQARLREGMSCITT